MPSSLRNWNYKRFLHKRNNIYKTIMAVGGWQPPAIIGLCEIENRFVLNQLVYETPFKSYDYRIIHEESPDLRGIDVALLFNPELIKVVNHEAISIHFPWDSTLKTRDILYVKMHVIGTGILHVYINHWPSRYGGELSSEPKRVFVAKQLADRIDALLKEEPNAAIVVLGDLNDSPSNKSVKEVLVEREDPHRSRLIQLMDETDNAKGTHKFNGDWGILDQILVSEVLMDTTSNMVIKGKGKVFYADFLLQKDKKYMGEKPFRTYLGVRYLGGFSDHLPIFVDMQINKAKDRDVTISN